MFKLFIIVSALAIAIKLVCGQATVAPQRPPFPDQTTDAFQNQMLQQHNYYRAIDQVGPLVLNTSVISYAKSRCQYLSQYPQLSVGHQGLLFGTYGENIYFGLASYPNAFGSSNCTSKWYNEITNPGYNFGNPTLQTGTGHFTQMVWKSSTQLGCAICGGIDSQGFYDTYIACNYYPAGNVLGYFAQNVFPPINTTASTTPNPQTTVTPVTTTAFPTTPGCCPCG